MKLPGNRSNAALVMSILRARREGDKLTEEFSRKIFEEKSQADKRQRRPIRGRRAAAE